MKRSIIISRCKKYFSECSDVVFAYLFGSVARDDSGPMSDVDVAVFLKSSKKSVERRLDMMTDLSRLLKKDRVDVVVLNDAPLTLRFHVVKDGVLLNDAPSERVSFETATLRDYLDTAHLREVQRQAMRRQLAEGTYFGKP